MWALFPQKCVIKPKWSNSVVIFFSTMQHLPKGLLWARPSIGYVVSAKQVAYPRYGQYGRSSGQNKLGLTLRTPFWTPLYVYLQGTVLHSPIQSICTETSFWKNILVASRLYKILHCAVSGTHMPKNKVLINLSINVNLTLVNTYML